MIPSSQPPPFRVHEYPDRFDIERLQQDSNRRPQLLSFDRQFATSHHLRGYACGILRAQLPSYRSIRDDGICMFDAETLFIPAYRRDISRWSSVGFTTQTGRIIRLRYTPRSARVTYAAIHRFFRELHENEHELMPLRVLCGMYPHQRCWNYLITLDDSGSIAVVNGLPMREMSESEYAYLIGESQSPAATNPTTPDAPLMNTTQQRSRTPFRELLRREARRYHRELFGSPAPPANPPHLIPLAEHLFTGYMAIPSFMPDALLRSIEVGYPVPCGRVWKLPLTVIDSYPHIDRDAMREMRSLIFFTPGSSRPDDCTCPACLGCSTRRLELIQGTPLECSDDLPPALYGDFTAWMARLAE